MKRGYITLLLLVSMMSSCRDGRKVVANYNNDNSSLDMLTTATPGGGKLKPAQEGPVRSVFGEPKIDLNSYTLTITGLVDSTVTLSWEGIQAFPAALSDTMLMYCVEGWEVWGNWKGILVKELLNKARPRPEGSYILFRCADGYTTALPTAYVVKYNAMLAYEVNGYPLADRDGYPLRLIAFGKLGYKWAKWVTRLEVINEARLGFWEGVGYSDRADVPMNRRTFYEGEAAEPLQY